jgi:hypothetical protein
MARKRRNADPWVRDLQLGYKAYLLDQKARQFEHFPSPTPLTAWDIAEEVEGSFYAYKPGYPTASSGPGPGSPTVIRSTQPGRLALLGCLFRVSKASTLDGVRAGVWQYLYPLRFF